MQSYQILLIHCSRSAEPVILGLRFLAGAASLSLHTVSMGESPAVVASVRIHFRVPTHNTHRQREILEAPLSLVILERPGNDLEFGDLMHNEWTWTKEGSERKSPWINSLPFFSYLWNMSIRGSLYSLRGHGRLHSQTCLWWNYCQLIYILFFVHGKIMLRDWDCLCP